MAEAEGIPPTASTASVGLGINYVGNWVYAYSGPVSCDNNETTLLDFRTQATIIQTRIVLNYSEVGAFAEDFLFKIQLNSEIVMQMIYDGAKLQEPPQWVPLLIPPNTNLKITAVNVTDTDARLMAAMLTGRVYGAV
jgi:hypothetical protein